MPFSDYIAYFDESGDHGLTNIDRNFPVFVLCGWVFRIDDYLSRDLGGFSAIKFAYFGHDAVIFHSREIRKRLGPFQILADAQRRLRFMEDIAAFYRGTTGVCIAAGIDKNRHVRQYAYPVNPYSIALLFCLERLYAHLNGQGVTGGTMTCVFEKRGEAEDKELAAQFVRICAGENYWGELPFKAAFASKLANMPGLQIADLAAYPIARNIMAPETPNPSYAAIEPRFRRSPKGRVMGWGLKVFP